MKDWLEKHNLHAHRSYIKLGNAVREAWEAITHEIIEEMIGEMPERCKAVAEANCSCTKY